MGFDVHIADPVKMAEIYKTSKKNDKESGNVEGHREQSKNIKGEGHKEDVR